ncbi:TIR-like protein FxsC [Plantactinospora sp. GCM10030261]|uniref:TIR-like protein FxsC n=1 Tax=Plantactinospora sp. GCM10030261 TaxID=3273420 RepID=UPI0036154332
MTEGLPYFFLSYARGDDDAYVRKFYEELCKEVRIRSGDLANPDVGFLDTRGIALGAPWSDELTRALHRSRTFLALCSPLYFNSEYCGKEWAVFADRVQRTTEKTGVRPPVMFPLVWMPRTEMHPAAQELQQTTDRLDPRYREHGLRTYMRLAKHRDRRFSFVSALAEMIVANARLYELPPPAGHPDITLVPSSFTATLNAGRTSPPSNRQTTKYVHFVVAATARSDMRPHRSSLAYYGDTYRDWAPYQPELTQPLGTYATAIATRQRFGAEVAAIADLPTHLRQAKERNQLLVLLVDAWAPHLSECESVLAAHGAGDSATTAVIVPVSRSDDESMHNWVRLDDRCRVLLQGHLRSQDLRMFRFGVPTHDHFGEVLTEVLETAYNRLLAEGRSLRTPPDPFVERPILDGPQPDTPEN